MYKQSIVWAPEDEENVDSTIIDAKEMAQKIIQNVEKVMVGKIAAGSAAGGPAETGCRANISCLHKAAFLVYAIKNRSPIHDDRNIQRIDP